MTNPHFTMPKVQVLVADANRARFFRLDSPMGDLIELNTEINPEARLHSGDLVTDRPGRQSEGAGEARSTMDAGSDPKEVEVQRFAKRISELVLAEKSANRLERLYLVAPPRFLGELRKNLNSGVKGVVVEEIAKDLSSLDARELRKHLPERLK